MTSRRIAAIALTAALVAGGAGAAVAAIGKDDARKAEQSVLDSAAKKLDVTPQALRDALSSAQDEQLDQAVKDGRLTQAQADAIKARRKQSGRVLGGPFGGRPGGPGGRGFGPGGPRGPGFGPGGPHRPGFGPGGPHGPGFGPGGPHGPGLGHHRRRGPSGHALFEDLAKALDLTPAKLVEQLRAGKSIAAVAKAQGKSLDDVRAAVKSAAKARADKAVKAGDLTQAQADEMLSRLDEVLKHIDASKPFFGKGRGHRGGPPPLRPGNQPGRFVPAPGGGGVFS